MGGILSFISVVSCELTIRCAGVQPVMLDPALYRFSSMRDLVTIAMTAEMVLKNSYAVTGTNSNPRTFACFRSVLRPERFLLLR